MFVFKNYLRTFAPRTHSAQTYYEAFQALSFTGNRQFHIHEGESSQGALMLVDYPLPDKGDRYPIGRGSGLFISCKAFGDASCKINKNIIPRFFF